MKNKFIDQNLYVYDYKDLKLNPNNQYILGVDWNESQFGVQAVVLEVMNQEEEIIPFNDGEWKTATGDIINPIKKKNVLRVFYADNVDGAEYTNMGAVDFILKFMIMPIILSFFNFLYLTVISFNSIYARLELFFTFN